MEKFSVLERKLIEIEVQNEELKSLVVNINQNTLKENKNKLSDYGFKVFSQWDEDGIIQFITGRINTISKVFVEIGVENYKESNTRFLLFNNFWRGFIIDGNKDQIEEVKKSNLMWRYNLIPHYAFVTKENINELLEQNGITGDIGLLSIDIDGVDYWIWDSINVISPDVVICEYQATFGFNKAVTVPYDRDFTRSKIEYHNIYYSSSIKALILLGERKGYTYLGSNNVGSNAFFVKNEYADLFTDINKEISTCIPSVREVTDSNAVLVYKRASDSINLISDLPLIDVENNQTIKVKDLNINS